MTGYRVAVVSCYRALGVDAGWRSAKGEEGGAHGARSVELSEAAVAGSHEAVKCRGCVRVVSSDGTRRVDGDWGRATGESFFTRGARNNELHECGLLSIRQKTWTQCAHDESEQERSSL